ncbi:GGDEF domain-containing protein [Amphritea japonica]|uniref:diguanylate cyclase n=1 Tax=Amphritea japonica ATCC BAA-1530 TaxID=1278309 RepID=A0A7R6SRV9_9GAMM|nr:GGDEF domain-containing protein [Amphritea japonica]BBB25664.1 signal transduction protein [Amphritea japonica ATCC BAA-1530]
MQKILQYILPFELPRAFSDNTFNELYNEWDKPSRQIQISVISCLTAFLYVAFTFIDKSSWAPEHVQALMLKSHMLIIAPMMLIISFLAYKGRFYKTVMLLLATSPVVAMLSHAYIASMLTNSPPFLAEGYLCVFWIFIVSGMTFRYALVSAIISSVILLLSAFYLMNLAGTYAIHAFWVFCSFSFGCLGALIFDRSRKAIFAAQQELHRLAITDSLTGVFNRNHLDNVLSQEVGRCLRYNQVFGLLIIDIDKFKSVNDTFGHATGDQVLQKTAQVLSQSIRENDTLIRWGGEEFIVIVLEADEQSLLCFCEKLRKTIEGEDYAVVGKVTVSIGATLFRESDSKEALISRADKVLYEAKEKGRNITVYT